MVTTIIGAIVTLIMGGGGAVAWWVRRQDAKKDPVPRSTAEVALAKEALGIVEASRDALSEDVARLRADVDNGRDRIEALTVEVKALRGEVHTIRTAWGDWYRDLRARWEHHRTQAVPPQPPALD